MTLVEHLYELRTRIAVALVAVSITMIFAYIWYSLPMFGYPNLGDLFKAPYCALPNIPHLTVGSKNECALVALNALDQLSLRLHVSLIVGAVLASPVWLYELWSFITPGLHSNERRYAIVFVATAAPLFMSGAALAYVVVSQSLDFLLQVGGDVQTTLLTGESYYDLIVALVVIFGLSFELPLLVVMLNRVGVVSYERLRRSRRGLIFGLFVFAAIATPSQDPWTMSILGGILTILFEMAIQITRIHDRRMTRRREQEEIDSWDPDVPLPFDPHPSKLGNDVAATDQQLPYSDSDAT